MPRFTARYLISPPGVFGIPDGARTVVPASPSGRSVVTPVLDTRTGKVASHGSFSEYRRPEDAVRLDCSEGAMRLSVDDNFCALSIEAADPADGYRRARLAVDLLCQTLAVQFGHRFSAEFISLEDEGGVPQRVPQLDSLAVTITWYELAQTRERLAVAFEWASNGDDRARKALLYFEHACLLLEFAGTLPMLGPHASFSHGMAFLQLFKALVTIVGEPKVDRDYQRRATQLGLSPGYWNERVKPLYDVRNDEDVAHYALADPRPGAYLRRFGQATTVFQEVFAAYMQSIRPSQSPLP